ncbi:MAG: DUF5660 family protein [Patescibacteria group bacterium]
MKPTNKIKSPPTNFFEALKDLGESTLSEAKVQIKKIVTDDIPQAVGLAPSGTLRQGESVSMAELKQAENKGRSEAKSEFNVQLRQMQEDERRRLLAIENQTRQQITSIQAEIKLLAQSTKELGKEFEIAASQAVVNPGVYHKNFFTHLSTLIRTLRQQVQESKHWLATTNSRASKRGGYWAGVKKSGTAFMLSSERYMVTSTG